MATYNCYGRLLNPIGSTTSASVKELGHYDLMIKGVHTFDDLNYTNLVISYGKDRNAPSSSDTGYLYVFNENMTEYFYRNLYGKFECHHYHFTSDGAGYAAFLSGVTSLRNKNSRARFILYDKNGNTVGYYYRYLITNSYKTYSVTSRNCFKAVGIMASALGDDRFTDYAKKYSYEKYKVKYMLQHHNNLWDLDDVYNEDL